METYRNINYVFSTQIKHCVELLSILGVEAIFVM